MNVVFRLPTEPLEEQVRSEAKKQKMVGLKGIAASAASAFRRTTRCARVGADAHVVHEEFAKTNGARSDMHSRRSRFDTLSESGLATPEGGSRHRGRLQTGLKEAELGPRRPSRLPTRSSVARAPRSRPRSSRRQGSR